MNKVILKGFITKDPEIKEFGENKKVANFTIAINRRFKKNETDFINCIAWNQLADFIVKYFAKGSEIAVVGRIEIDKYTNSEGKTQYAAKINIEEAYFTGKKSDINNNTDKSNSEKINSSNNSKANKDDDDVPF